MQYLGALLILAVSWQAKASFHQARQMDTKIVGGTDAPDQYPYQISLQVKVPFYMAILQSRDWQHNCGGSIVTTRHVVSAAHCLKGYNVTGLSILAGTRQLNGKDGTRLLVQSYLIHPDYVELNRSDIGIITTREAFVLGDKIKCISYSSEPVGGGQTVVLTGWGFTRPVRFGGPPNELQKIVLQTLTNEQCIANGQTVDPTGICTDGRLLNGACGGDSGGPLAMGNNLVGVVSYGTSICAIGFPDVYTRVSVFAHWIKANTLNY